MEVGQGPKVGCSAKGKKKKKNVLVLTVRCKLINFVFQIIPLFIPEMPAGFFFN
jgi:hypothetical protein